MKVALLLCGALVVAGTFSVGCKCPSSAKAEESAHVEQCPACAKGAQGEAVWCEKCAQGFVGGEKVACKGCYAAKTGGPPCEACAAKNAAPAK